MIILLVVRRVVAQLLGALLVPPPLLLRLLLLPTYCGHSSHLEPASSQLAPPHLAEPPRRPLRDEHLPEVEVVLHHVPGGRDGAGGDKGGAGGGGAGGGVVGEDGRHARAHEILCRKRAKRCMLAASTSGFSMPR